MADGSETERVRQFADLPSDIEFTTGIIVAMEERREELEKSGL